VLGPVVSNMIDEHRGPGWEEISVASCRSPCSMMTPVQLKGGLTLCEEAVCLCSRARLLTDDLIPLRDERVRVADLCSVLMICPDQGPSLHRWAARWLAATGASLAEEVDQQLCLFERDHWDQLSMRICQLLPSGRRSDIARYIVINRRTATVNPNRPTMLPPSSCP
jgi:hypothetical protein